MAIVYTLNFTDPSKSTFTIQPRGTDGPTGTTRTTDLDLVGMGSDIWGEKVQENLIHLLENFACPESAPGVPSVFLTPVQGQLWYNSTTNTLYVYDGSAWTNTNPYQTVVTVSASPPLASSANSGDLWWNTADTERNLYVFLSGVWTRVIDDYLRRSGGTMIGALTLSGAPTADFHAATKLYVDNLVSGLTWIDPIHYVNLIADNVSNPAALTPDYADVYIIPAGGGAGAWAGKPAGTIVIWNGTTWVEDTDDGLLSNHPTGTRFGISMESATVPGGSFAGKADQIAILTNPAGPTWSFYTPVDNNATFVSNQESLHAYHQYVYDATNVKWVEFGGGAALRPGSNLTLTGNILNVKDFSAGGTVDAAFLEGQGAGSFISTAGGTMLGDLTLNGDPTIPLHAATKQYVDNEIVANNIDLPVYEKIEQIGYSTSIGTLIELSISVNPNLAMTALNATDVVLSDVNSPSLRVYRFDGTTWAAIATTFPGSPTLSSPAVAALNSTDVAYIDANADQLRTWRLTAGTWSTVGNPLNITNVGIPRLAALNATEVALINSNTSTLRLYRFDGTNWAPVGNALSLGVGYATISPLTSNTIAFYDSTIQELRMYSFAGLNWTQVGNSLGIASTIGSVSSITSLDYRTVVLGEPASQSLQAYRFDGINWAPVGNTFSLLGVTGSIVLSKLNSSDVAYLDSGSHTFKTFRFDGIDWHQLETANIGIPALTSMTSSEIAFFDSTNDSLRAFQYNGLGWIPKGIPFPVTLSGDPALTSLNTTDVVLINDVADQLQTYRFNGFTWAPLGNPLPISGVNLVAPALTTLSSNTVAFISSGNGNLRTYQFDGTNWAQVGNSLFINPGYPALTALNSNTVAFIDSFLDQLRTYQFDGTNWAQVGSSLSIPGMGNPALSALNSTDVVLDNAAAGTIQIYRFDGTTWSSVSPALSTTTPGASTRALAAVTASEVVRIDGITKQLQTYHIGQLIGGNTVADDLDMNSNRIVNVADPINNKDAVNKSYADMIGIVSSLVAPQGFLELGNGLIVQWGISNTGFGTDLVIFPIPFPNAVFSAVATVHDGGMAGILNLTVSGMDIYKRTPANNNNTSPAGWIVIGY